MILRGKLLWGKFECCHHLLRQISTFLETKRVEHDLTDKCIVWHHHCHRPKESFQVIRKLSSTCVTGVHSDEDWKGGKHAYVTTLEIAFWRSFCFFSEKNEKLLSDDRQHFNVDTVKLVETAPGACWSQSLEEFADHDIVHWVWTVEHHTLLC